MDDVTIEDEFPPNEPLPTKTQIKSNLFHLCKFVSFPKTFFFSNDFCLFLVDEQSIYLLIVPIIVLVLIYLYQKRRNNPRRNDSTEGLFDFDLFKEILFSKRSIDQSI